ncbi:hypothetical protein AgCh_036266 [Apium graveolens]
MDSNKLTPLLLISMLIISTTADPILDCGSCRKPPNHHKHIPKPPKVPTIKPPIVKPPIVKPPVNLPPGILPPRTAKPPTRGKPGKPCPSPPSSPSAATCPIDALKLGACVDVLGGLVHVGLNNPAVNKCCRLIAGLAELEAAACLCSALKLKLINLNIYVPIALQLLITCGKPPPSGYTCSL